MPDERKAGGKYVSVIDEISKIDELERVVVLNGGEHIRIYDILDVELIKREN